jgi:glycosyltransferase involved in cell wall biosynthesis
LLINLNSLGKLKVLLLIDGGFLGGGQTNVLSIARILDKKRFDISIAAEGGGAFEEEAAKYNIPFTPITLPKLLRTKYLRYLVALYASEKFDIIHTHGGVAGFYGRTLKKHHPEIKCVHTIHGIHYVHSSGFLKRNLSKTIEQYLVQFTDKTICVSETDLVKSVKYRIADIDKTIVIPNGIDIARFSNPKKNLGLMKVMGLNEENFIVGNVSRFDIQKNQRLIIQSAYFLVRKYPNVRFVLVGGGELKKRMKQLVMESNLEDYIIFTGETDNVQDYYSIFDIFVFPTLWEGMPYVLLEAMASRLPVICSSLPNLLEVVKPNYSALTISPNNMDDLFQKTSALYQNAELRERLAQNAMIESTQYDESELIPRVGDVYEEVMNG